MKLLSYYDLKPEKGIPYSSVQIWRLVREGKFPKPVKIGAGRNLWPDTVIDEYIRSLMQEDA